MKVHAKRRGDRATVYIADLKTGVPVPLSGPDDNPVDAAPRSMTVQQAEALYGANNIHWHVVKHEPNLEDRIVVSDAQIQLIAKDLVTLTPEQRAAKVQEISGVPVQQQRAVANVSKVTIADVVAEQQYNTEGVVGRLTEHLISEFRNAYLQMEASEMTRDEFTAIGTFLINAFPELEEQLKEAAAPKRPKKVFTLG